MARIITAGVAGAVVYFIWGMLTWIAIPLHGPTIKALPAEQGIVDALKAQKLESGVYVAPYAAEPADMSDPKSTFMKNHVAGPIFSIYYQEKGTAPMNPGMLAGGFVLNLLAAILAACLLSSVGPCAQNYWCRVGFVTGLGIFVALVAHLNYWNWMYFPLGYTVAFVVDVTVGWSLAGLAIAAFVQPATNVSNPTNVDLETKPQQPATPKPATPKPAKPKPATPVRNDAITLLATLQREARLVDIVMEPLGEYSDAQVGAAARDVLRDCGTVLERLFKLTPIVEQEDGANIEIPTGEGAERFRISGKVTGEATSGALVHHGWQAQQCELPKWTGAKDLALIISPAELEVK